MSELPRIVVRVEQQAVDKKWPFGVSVVGTGTIVYRTQEEAAAAETELTGLVDDFEAGRLTLYLETQDDATHTVVTFGKLQSPQGAVRSAVDTLARWAERYLPGVAMAR